MKIFHISLYLLLIRHSYYRFLLQTPDNPKSTLDHSVRNLALKIVEQSCFCLEKTRIYRVVSKRESHKQNLRYNNSQGLVVEHMSMGATNADLTTLVAGKYLGPCQ